MNALCLGRNSERFSASKTSRNLISSIQQLIRHALGVWKTNYCWCVMMQDFLGECCSHDLQHKNAGQSECWLGHKAMKLVLISPDLGWASLAGEMETQLGRLDTREGKNRISREKKSETVQHCQVVLVGKVLNSPQPCSPAPWRSQDFRGAPSLPFQADSHHFNRP